MFSRTGAQTVKNEASGHSYFFAPAQNTDGSLGLFAVGPVPSAWVDGADRDARVVQALLTNLAADVTRFYLDVERRQQNSETHTTSSEQGRDPAFRKIVGASKPIQEVLQVLRRIQESESSVLIEGENGTGKEVVARAIHETSMRKNQPFITVNCSAFNENLLDSELFGHVKGAFTGAIKDKKGFFEQANGGTLFLDEIGDMSMTMQVKLLRVLQEGTFFPVGSTESKYSDVRILAATNRNLKKMIADATFREDLYYRVNVIHVQVPPLRDRITDIPLLVESFLQRICSDRKMPPKKLSERAIEALQQFPWPGNIRELQNEMERVVVLGGNQDILDLELLSSKVTESRSKSVAPASASSGSVGVISVPDSGMTLKQAMEQLEIEMISKSLRKNNWNKSKVARELGVSRASLIMKVDKYQLDKRSLKRDAA